MNKSFVQLGNQATFEENTVLFFLIGIGFGTSYSMTKINLLDWNNTSVIKKVIRMVIASGIYFGIYELFQYFSEGSNYETSEKFFY